MRRLLEHYNESVTAVMIPVIIIMIAVTAIIVITIVMSIIVIAGPRGDRDHDYS